MAECRFAEISELVGVMRVGGEYRLVATRPVPADTRLFTIDGQMVDAPNRFTVQVGAAAHIDVPSGFSSDEIQDRFSWRFMNHSCDPTVAIRGRDVYSIGPLEPWHEITFDYDTTEYEMAEPFECHCRAPECRGRIGGFRFLAPAERQRLRPWLADHLLPALDREPGAEEQHVYRR